MQRYVLKAYVSRASGAAQFEPVAELSFDAPDDIAALRHILVAHSGLLLGADWASLHDAFNQLVWEQGPPID